MEIVTTIAGVRALLAKLRGGRTVGMVPTMGALHAGHLSLVRACRERCDVKVASIFVNPTQFGPTEDFSKYPRTMEADCRMLEGEGVDVLFAPTAEEMYPSGLSRTFVDVPGIGDRLDGRSRPGHFRGVATVVAKLFQIVTPEVAFFGQKDAAQVAVLRAMVRDLNIPVEMVVGATVREEDGLAMSSRNRYLSEGERVEARVFSAALVDVQAAVDGGLVEVEALRRGLREGLERSAAVRVDYAEIVDAETLEPVSDLRAGALVAVAGWVGSTRLIDNVLLAPVEAKR